MLTTSTPHISEAVREALRALLSPRVLQRNDTDFDIGYENCKQDIRFAIEQYTGGPL